MPQNSKAISTQQHRPGVRLNLTRPMSFCPPPHGEHLLLGRFLVLVSAMSLCRRPWHRSQVQPSQPGDPEGHPHMAAAQLRSTVYRPLGCVLASLLTPQEEHKSRTVLSSEDLSVAISTRPRAHACSPATAGAPRHIQTLKSHHAGQTMWYATHAGPAWVRGIFSFRMAAFYLRF